MSPARARRARSGGASTGASPEGEPASRLIDAKLDGMGGWQGPMLSRLRALIRSADPEIIEEVKWRKPTNPQGVPVWSCHGIICTGEAYKDHVKLTFALGASLPDPKGLLNGSLGGRVTRAVDLHEGDEVDERALVALVRAAIAANVAADG